MKSNFVLQLIHNTAMIVLFIGLMGLIISIISLLNTNSFSPQFLWVSSIIFVFSLVLFGISEIIFQLIKQNQILEQVLKKLEEK